MSASVLAPDKTPLYVPASMAADAEGLREDSAPVPSGGGSRVQLPSLLLFNYGVLRVQLLTDSVPAACPPVYGPCLKPVPFPRYPLCPKRVVCDHGYRVLRGAC